MTRRASLFGLLSVVLVCLIVMAVPVLRHMTQANFWVLNGGYTDPWQNYIEEILARHPDDLRILAYRAAFKKSRLERLEALDKLIARHPTQTWLVAMRLKYSTVRPLGIDDGYSTNRKSWLDRAELSKALRLAEYGAHQEPRNAFYDWMRVLFLLSLKRKQEALAAAAAGAQKEIFDDGTIRERRMSFEISSLLRPPHWEERMSTFWDINTYHLSAFNQLNHVLVMEGALAETQGNHARALRIYGSQMRLCRNFRRHSVTLAHLQYALAMLKRVWVGDGRRSKKSDSVWSERPERLKRLTSEAGAFAAYAAKHKDKTLADETLQEMQKIAGTDWAINSATTPFAVVTPFATIKALCNRRISSITAILLAGAGAAGWLFLSFCSWLLRRFKRFHPSREIPLRDITLTVLPALLCVLLGLCLFTQTQSTLPPYSWAMDGNFEKSDVESLGYNLLIFSLIAPFALPFLVIVFTILARAHRANPAPHNDTEMPLRIRWKSWRIWGLIIAMSCWSAIALAVNYALYQFMIVERGYEPLRLLLLPFLILCAGGLHWFIWRAMAIWSMRRIEWRYAFAWARSTLGAMTVLAVLAYIPLLLWLRPISNEADEYLNRAGQRGEVPLWREYFRRNPPAP